MGSGCGGSGARYQTTPGNEDDLIDALKPPKQAPPEIRPNGAPPDTPTSTSSHSLSVAHLKQRLQELGWKLPVGSVEKSDLQRMVKEAEEQHANREAAKASRSQVTSPRPATVPTVTTASTRNIAAKSGSTLTQTSANIPASGSTSRPATTPERIRPESSPTASASRSVADLKKRLHELGYVIPVHMQEKKDLIALVEKAEEQLQNKQNRHPSAPSSSSSGPRSVAQLKSRLQELGVKVPQGAVEKRELVILIEEAERKFEQKSRPQSQDDSGVPTSPSNDMREKTIKCDKTKLGVSKIQVSEEPFAPASPSHAEVVRGREFTWTKGKLIGRGALGLVYRAEASGDTIAVKEVMIDTAERRETKFKEDLENEICIMKELKHENIVSYRGHDYVDDRLFIYLDYMPGGSVSHVLKEYGPFDENLLARYAKQLLKGLEYLHTQSPPVIHRDIKGGNVLIGRDDVVKWADFGCSKRMDSEKTQTMLRGSIPWMAPEVVAHSRYGWFSDVWSFGCLIIEMGTARQPWGNFENQVAALMKIGMSQETPPLPEGVSEECQGLITLCCQREAQNRPSTSELLQHAMLRDVP